MKAALHCRQAGLGCHAGCCCQWHEEPCADWAATLACCATQLPEEPSEAEFQALQARLFGNQANGEHAAALDTSVGAAMGGQEGVEVEAAEPSKQGVLQVAGIV